MSKITKHYKLIQDTDINAFNTIVENHLNTGWNLYGDPSGSTIKKVGDQVVFMQAVIKQEQSPSEVSGNISVR